MRRLAWLERRPSGRAAGHLDVARLKRLTASISIEVGRTWRRIDSRGQCIDRWIDSSPSSLVQTTFLQHLMMIVKRYRGPPNLLNSANRCRIFIARASNSLPEVPFGPTRWRRGDSAASALETDSIQPDRPTADPDCRLRRPPTPTNNTSTPRPAAHHRHTSSSQKRKKRKKKKEKQTKKIEREGGRRVILAPPPSGSSSPTAPALFLCPPPPRAYTMPDTSPPSRLPFRDCLDTSASLRVCLARHHGPLF